MSPELITSITQIAALIERMSNWPFASLLLVLVIGPWVLSLSLAYTNRRHIEKIERYYNDNVSLVKDYQSLGGGLKELAEELRDIVVLNTREWSSVKECVQGNQYCPLLRKDRKIHQSIED